MPSTASRNPRKELGKPLDGTGDVDWVYRFALKELEEAIDIIGAEDSAELIDNMIRGNRLKDIGDLPLDVAV